MASLGQKSPKQTLTRSPSKSEAASEKASAWAKKKQAAMAKAAELKAERNGKQHIEDEFNKQLEAANDSLVCSWTNDEFAKITKSPSIKLTPKKSFKSPNGDISDQTTQSNTKKEKLTSKQKDEEMLQRLRVLEEERTARRAAATDLKNQRGDVLAAHPGMAADDVSFFVMLKHWRQEREAYCVHNNVVNESETLGDILCCIRKRPLLPREIQNKVFDVISCSMHGAPASTAVLHEPKEGVDLRKQLKHHSFTMNGGVFDEESRTIEVYEARVAPLVRHVLRTDGARATVLAYGQTGSGKTHTMIGNGGGEGDTERGVYALAAMDLFEQAAASTEITVAYFELYKGQLYDLLEERRQLELLEDSKGAVTVVGLSHSPKLTSVDQLLHIISAVTRSTSSTSSNETSSRSHAILQINIVTMDGHLSKLTFVDLAGSEWFDDSNSHDKEAAVEGAEINKSLLSLKECIRALGGKDSYGLKGDDKAARHVPFRGSKLTRLLKDSLVGPAGACKTLMIAQVSPASSVWEHSLNTLRYADRVGSLPPNTNSQSKKTPKKSSFKSPTTSKLSTPKTTPKTPSTSKLSNPKTTPKSPTTSKLSNPKTTPKTPSTSKLSNPKTTPKTPTTSKLSTPKTTPKTPTTSTISKSKTTVSKGSSVKPIVPKTSVTPAPKSAKTPKK